MSSSAFRRVSTPRSTTPARVTRALHRPLRIFGATVLLFGAALVAGGGVANAEPSGRQVYHYSEEIRYFCVPTGVTTVRLDAVGGGGGDFGSTGGGGRGARITGTFPVVADTELVVIVGQWGHGEGGRGDGHGGKHGTAPGGTLGNSGAGGGGSTAVKSTANRCGTHNTDGAQYMVAAGGGGGAGGNSDPAASDGGHGGNAGRDGAPGIDGAYDSQDDLYGGQGGCGGRPPGGGCNDSRHGGDGTDIQTGMAGGGGGGGGGGGYLGGGKGHGAYLPFHTTGGGGGGGGASYVDPIGANVVFSIFDEHNAEGFAIIDWGTGDPGSQLPCTGSFCLG